MRWESSQKPQPSKSEDWGTRPLDEGPSAEMTGNMYWIGPTVIVLLRLLYAEAFSTKVSDLRSVLVFRFPIVARLLTGFGITALFVLLVRSIGHEELWVSASGAGLLILLCLGWPSTITIDSTGVTRHLWWKPKRYIPWDAVVDLEKNSAGDFWVYGSNGECIAYSRYHADPGRFKEEVLRRAKLRTVTDLSSPTTLSNL